MQRFESLYGEVLFDNTIDLSDSRQADLNLLEQRRFRSYRNAGSGTSGERASEQFRNRMRTARLLVTQTGELTVSDSQLLRLMTLCQTEKNLFELLTSRRDLLLNFCEKPKLNPRRKMIK